jgi:hypothetical protein
LKALCRAGKLRLVLTDVTVREIEARIDEKVNEAARALRKTKKEANILLPLGIPGLEEVFSKTDKKAAYRESLKKLLHEFLDEAHCEVVKVNAVRVSSVFDLYFEKKPPFGEGKKKDEFPDAFALAALRTRREENGGKIYVVSDDGDMAKACGNPSPFIYMADLSELLELTLKDEGLATKEAHDRFLRVRTEIEERVRAASETDLYMSLIDQDGDAQKVKVEHVHLNDESVVTLSDAGAKYTLIAEVSFQADIKYPDPNFVGYDSETGTLFYYDFIEETVSRNLEVPVEVSIWFDQADIEANEVDQVTVNNGDSLWIYAGEDEWPFK